MVSYENLLKLASDFESLSRENKVMRELLEDVYRWDRERCPGSETAMEFENIRRFLYKPKSDAPSR